VLLIHKMVIMDWIWTPY